jgi:hypothetical protein
VALGALVVLGASPARAENDPRKIVGPNECAECHKVETEVWKGTHHFSTFLELPRNDKAREIADKMGMRRIKAESLCLTCHFTVQAAAGKEPDAISGISCESCHSAAKDWLKVHSEYSGKKKETETPAEAKARWAKSEAAGMIRPHDFYGLAKNCYGCHVVPQEKLVNTGGHTAGSAFELVAWSQGEIRHNTWYNDGKANPEADPNRKRMMYVVGTAVELETSLRSVGKATERAAYAVAMARRAAAARTTMDGIAKALPSVPEAAEIAAAGNAPGLKLNNDAELSAAADKVAAATKRLSTKYDGSTFAGIDSMLPTPDKYKGKPAR